MKAVIIGATRGIRRVDPSKSYPSILREGPEGKRILDWIYGSLTQAGIEDITVVGGYHIEKLIRDYPQFHYYYDADWQTNGSLNSLFCARNELTGPCLVMTPDVVFNSAVVTHLLKTRGDIIAATMPYTSSSRDSAYVVDQNQDVIRLITQQTVLPDQDLSVLAGIFMFSEKGLTTITGHYDNLRQGTVSSPYIVQDNISSSCISDLVQSLVAGDHKVSACFLENDVSRVDDSLEFSRFVLRSKAETLENLQGRLKNARVLDQIRFSQKQWLANAATVLEELTDKFNEKQVVIRSSSYAEDSWGSSQAGRFHSELGVAGGCRDELTAGIDRVVEHYEGLEQGGGANHIFVQEQLVDVKLAGVLFTRDLETGAPYYVINYDNTTGTTDSITSGLTDQISTTFMVKKCQIPGLDTVIDELISIAHEIEILVGHDALDIEFAIDKDGNRYLFQVRPLVFRSRDHLIDHSDFHEEITNIQETVSRLLKPHRVLLGEKTVLGNMPDWNPAEMIGDTPHPLAISLYQYLITDYTWAQARAVIGYRNVYPCPLLFSFAGHPYIDCRASFNSFLPAELPDDLSAKLVEHYQSRLTEHPEFHDKIEFLVALTCYTPDFDLFAKQLLGPLFSERETETLKNCLLELTNNILSAKVEPISKQIGLIGRLEQKRKLFIQYAPDDLGDIAVTISCLLDDCICYGTTPFSILARYAFIATSILQSFLRLGILQSEELDELLSSIPTVATGLSDKHELLCKGGLSKEDFLEEFGHLRPGTYDINSYRYDEAFHRYFNIDKSCCTNQAKDVNNDSLNRGRDIFMSKSRDINAFLADAGILITADTLYDFIVESIQGREFAKFEFTKNISMVMVLLEQFGQGLGVSRNDMAYLPIKFILDLKQSSARCGIKRDLRRVIETNKKRHAVTQSIKLPHMIFSADDVVQFDIQGCKPNFITSKNISAAIINLDNECDVNNIAGKIVVMEKADPGYDWIFGHTIAGLITKYGGAASHMAIRAAEFGLPAAIGCGELMHKRVSKAGVVELNCTTRQINILE